VPLALDGPWRFALDRADVGQKESWCARTLADRIVLPGILQAQGYGDPIDVHTPWAMRLYDRNWFLRQDFAACTAPGQVKVPFLCQPQRYYVGVAWYQRTVDIPPAWLGRRVALHLERPRWESTVWLDKTLCGAARSLCTPHNFELGMAAPGTHVLTIRVDNRMILPYRPDSHSVSDSEGSTWNGIVGRMELCATSPVWIGDAQAYPDVEKKSVTIKGRIGNSSGQAGTGTISVASSAGGAAPLGTAAVSWDAHGGTFEITAALGADAVLWDEFHPALQHLTVALAGNHADDCRGITFGLREFKAQGQQFLLNGRPVYLRGTHDGGGFPLTGAPPTDVASWKAIIGTCQTWGLNHMRFHSWCPPEAAFTAADELGFFLAPECGMWNPFSPGSDLEKMLYAETEHILQAYGNHPSFVLLSPSNEPAGHWTQSLPQWVTYWKQREPRRLFTMNTGREYPGAQATAQYLVLGHLDGGLLRGPKAWFGQDFGKPLEKAAVPAMAHELGQWCAYPDFDVIHSFTGYLRPGNYEIFRASAAAHGLLEKNKDFAWASGRLQLACYKEEIEANLRTPGMAGFQLLDLHDYMGQGTALVGVLDPFWKPKGYATPEEYRQFCNTTVPLARLSSRIWTTADTLTAPVEVAHYGAAPLARAASAWKIVAADGAVLAQGQFPVRDIPLGKNIPLGAISVPLANLPAPRACKLVVRLQAAAEHFENQWNFWLYPPQLDTAPPPEVLLTSSWDQTEARLATGGKVLFQPRLSNLDWSSPPLATVPIFWNRLMGPGWNRMLGLWCDTRHPALAEFPTEACYDWQWTDLIRTRAVNLDRLPAQLQPIVQAIDDWNRNYKLGTIFECTVGPGKLLVCSFDLANPSPVGRQLRRSLLDYLAGAHFQPAVAVAPEALRALWFDNQIMRRLGAQAEGAGALAIDGDPNTFWQAGKADAPRQPLELAISFPQPVAMSGLVLLPRQNDRDHIGDIRDYLVQTSPDGRQWQDVQRGALASTWNPQQILFPQTLTTRYLKFVALSGFGDDPTAALAELTVIYAGPKLPDTDLGPTQYKRAKSTATDIEDSGDVTVGTKPGSRRKK